MRPSILLMAARPGIGKVLQFCLALTCWVIACQSYAQQITGGPSTVGEAGSRTMNIYTMSAGGGVTGNVHPTTTFPTFFGSIGQPMTIIFGPVPPNTNFTDNGAGVMVGADFMFGSSTLPATAPTAQPTLMVFSSFTTTSYNVAFTAASPAPAGYLVLRSAGSVVTANPSVGNTYTVGSTFGGATVVSVGAATSFNQTGLTPGTVYYYAAFSYNGTGGTTNYLTTSPLTGNSLSAPAGAQPTTLVLSNPSATGVTVSFTAGTGADGYIALRKASALPASLPVNATVYTSGATIGDAYVSYVGTSTSFPETLLSPGTEYYYEILSYKGTGISTNYLTTSPLTGTSLDVQPATQPTLLSFSAITQSSFNVSFSAVAGADGYIVLRKVDSAPVATPVDATVYIQGATLGDGTVAYAGPATIFSESSLATGTNFYYSIYAYKGSGITTNYLTTTPLTGNQSTLVAEPTGQPSFLTFSNVAPTTLTVSFTAASPAPSGYIVIRRAISAPTGAPVDGTAYVKDDPVGNGTVAYVGSAVTFNDTGLSPGTDYFYAVYSYNGSATSSNFLISGAATGTVKTGTADSSPPVITNNTPLTADPSMDITIKATVREDESAVTAVSVEYRSVSGAATFITQPMTLVSGSWEYKVLAAEIGDLGIEFKISATSSAPTAGTLTGKTAILYKSGLSFFDSDLPPGSAATNYRIIALPLVLTPNTVIGIFNQLGDIAKDWRVYHYTAPGPKAIEWKENSLLVPGQGYWFIRRNSTEIAIVTTNSDGPVQGKTVDATLAQPFTVNLSPGWNQIGNPYLFNVLWSDVLTASGLPATQKLRTYNGNFVDGDRLKRFEGGFVNVTAATTLIFPVVKNPAAGRISDQPVQRKMNSIDQQDWDVTISLFNGDRTNVFGGVGMNHEAKLEVDPYDDFTLPRFLDFVELNHGKTFINSAYTKDVVPTQQNYTWDFTVESSLGGITDMTWDNSYFGKNDKHLVLVDAESKEIVDMREAISYSFSSTPTHKFKVVYGSKDYVLSNALPTELAISKVYPNPSSSQVSVGFTLPNSSAPSPVQVKLINMMGQTVTRIFDGNLAPGYYEMTWNGLDDQNLRPAQGVYFMQVQGGKATVQQRVILK